MNSSLRLVASKNSKTASPFTNLHSVPLRMLSSSLPTLPPFASKAARLSAVRPDVAAVLERLVDRYLQDES